jgi:hypothetical protein
VKPAPSSTLRRIPALGMLVCLALLLSACSSPDPQAELALDEGMEAHWAVESPVAGTQYIAPVVRLKVRNKGQHPQRSVQATVTFRRQGEDQIWSSAWQVIAPVDGKPLAPGETRLAMLKPEGEGRYHSTGAPESMFQHPLFKDVRGEVFLKVGSSAWSKFATVEVERRIGPRAAASPEP